MYVNFLFSFLFYFFSSRRSFGKVYKAQHKTTGFVVAIKCIKFDSTVDEKRVLKELDVLKLARGKNIVSYFGRCLRKNHIWVRVLYSSIFGL
jgi:serine/threonine protein kinase